MSSWRCFQESTDLKEIRRKASKSSSGSVQKRQRYRQLPERQRHERQKHETLRDRYLRDRDLRDRDLTGLDLRTETKETETRDTERLRPNWTRRSTIFQIL